MPNSVKKKWDSDIYWDAKTSGLSLDETTLGIVDIARLGKSIMAWENQGINLDPNISNSANKDSTTDWGLMMLNDNSEFGFQVRVAKDKEGYFKNIKNITSLNWKSDPFVNIGGGIGALFEEYSSYTTGNNLGSWRKAVARYNDGGNGEIGSDYEIGVYKYFLRNFGRKIGSKRP